MTRRQEAVGAEVTRLAQNPSESHYLDSTTELVEGYWLRVESRDLRPKLDLVTSIPTVASKRLQNNVFQTSLKRRKTYTVPAGHWPVKPGSDFRRNQPAKSESVGALTEMM